MKRLIALLLLLPALASADPQCPPPPEVCFVDFHATSGSMVATDTNGFPSFTMAGPGFTFSGVLGSFDFPSNPLAHGFFISLGRPVGLEIGGDTDSPNLFDINLNGMTSVGPSAAGGCCMWPAIRCSMHSTRVMRRARSIERTLSRKSP